MIGSGKKASGGRFWSKRPVTSLPLALGLLSFAHLLSDTQQGMIPVILLYQQQSLGLSLAQIGLVAGLYNLVISLSQPVFGHLSDRWGEGRIVLLGATWVAIFGGTLGLASSAGLLLLAAGLAALGPAAFHPAGAAAVGRLTTARRGLVLSIFFVGGTLGHATGPLVAASVFDAVGLQGTVWIALAILAIALVVLTRIPFSEPAGSTRRATSPEPAAPESKAGRRESPVPRAPWLAVVALLIVTAVRTWLQLGLATYVPQKLVSVGLEPGRASGGLALMQASVALGVLIGGPLIDRYGPRTLTAIVLAALAPVVVFFARSSEPGAAWALPLAGLLTGVPLAMTFVIGQSYLPTGKGLASGLVFATSSIAGAAGVALTGAIAQQRGLVPALTILGVMPLIASVASLALPKAKVASVAMGA